MSDLVKFDANGDDYIRSRLRNKATREHVRRESETDPEAIERRRRDIGVLLNDARESLTAVYKIFGRLKEIDEAVDDESAAERSRLTEELRNRCQFSLLVNGLCQSYALSTIIDCVTVREEFLREAKGDDGIMTRKWRAMRFSIGGMLHELMSGDDEEDLEEGEAPFPGLRTVLAELPQAAQLETLGKLFHDDAASRYHNLKVQIANGPKPDLPVVPPFAEMIQDEHGVDQFIEDWYLAAARAMREDQERRRVAAQRSATHEGVDVDEQASIDDILGRKE